MSVKCDGVCIIDNKYSYIVRSRRAKLAEVPDYKTLHQSVIYNKVCSTNSGIIPCLVIQGDS